MNRVLLAIAPLAAVVLAASACGDAEPAQDVSSTPTQDIESLSVVEDSVVSAATASVVKIESIADSCQKKLDATGFVVAPNRVMSIAHGVAGADNVSVGAGGDRYDAEVVLYDPDLDIAVLDVPNLDVPPLSFDFDPVRGGEGAVMLGFPGGGEFVAAPARVSESIELSGPNIYHTATVKRDVITFEGAVEQGISGGPLIDGDGEVLGIVFGRAADDSDSGFALSVKEFYPQFAQSVGATQVETGECIA